MSVRSETESQAIIIPIGALLPGRFSRRDRTTHSGPAGTDRGLNCVPCGWRGLVGCVNAIYSRMYQPRIW